MTSFNHFYRYYLLMVAVLMCGLLLILNASVAARAQDDSQFFPETGKTVSGKFLQYWRSNGGLPVYGFPITDPQPEVDPETGKTFLTQWFERNRFELHPENAGTRYEVLLGLLGKDLRRETLTIDPDFVRTDPLTSPVLPKEQQVYFQETAHNLRGRFFKYWQDNGGLERFGFPIDEEHQEIDPETGSIFLTQWFERARFEYHPENQKPYDILLGLLGNQIKFPKSTVDYAWKLGRPYNELTRPYGIGVDPQGTTYVIDIHNRIVKYDSNGQFLTRWGSQGTLNEQFGTLTALAPDNLGNVYVGDSFGIKKFDSTGKFITKWGVQGTAQPVFLEKLVVDGQGIVYALNTNNENPEVYKFDANGRTLLSWGSKGTDDGQFNSPTNIAADGQGNVFIIDLGAGGNARIQKFDTSGHFLLKWVGSFSRGNGIAADTQGNVYVLGFDGIQKFDTQGQALGLLTRKGFGRGDGQLNNARGLALDSQGNIYVADTLNNRVQKFDKTGGYLAKWGSQSASDADGQFVIPNGVVLDREGNIYILDSFNGRVQKFDKAGHFLTKWGSPGEGDGLFSFPPGLAIDAQSNIYVLDGSFDNPRIQKFDSAGRFLLTWGGKGSENGKFAGPVAIAVDGQGNVYVLDNSFDPNFAPSVQKFDSSGTFLLRWGSRGSGQGQFNIPTGIGVDSSGNVYVVESGNARVQKFDSNGQFLLKWGGTHGVGDGQFNNPRAIAVDSHGQIYVADGVRVQKFDPGGQFITKWGSKLSVNGSADGQFSGAGGIALDNQDNVYVAETSNNRLQKFHQR